MRALNQDEVLAKLMSRTLATKAGCWEYQGRRMADGYGIYHGPDWLTTTLTHRISWILHHGHPGDLCVLHRCDNPPCVRPSHLFLGTRIDNAADMVKKGRARGTSRPGSSNAMAKLTEADVREIRVAYASGWTQQALGEWYGVTASAIWQIVHLRNWKTVESEACS